jgi:hypothetical protein
MKRIVRGLFHSKYVHITTMRYDCNDQQFKIFTNIVARKVAAMQRERKGVANVAVSADGRGGKGSK